MLLLLCFCVLYYSKTSPGLNFNALAANQSSSKDAMNIPSDFNFIQDDKKAFISYAQNYIEAGQDLNIDDSTYLYYGTVDGYRLYRMNISLMPAENLNHEETIGGYAFKSSLLFRPYASGLYIIGESGVYTLDDAYKAGLVDMSHVYSLYVSKK